MHTTPSGRKGVNNRLPEKTLPVWQHNMYYSTALYSTTGLLDYTTRKHCVCTTFLLHRIALEDWLASTMLRRRNHFRKLCEINKYEIVLCETILEIV